MGCPNGFTARRLNFSAICPLLRRGAPGAPFISRVAGWHPWFERALAPALGAPPCVGYRQGARAGLAGAQRAGVAPRPRALGPGGQAVVPAQGRPGASYAPPPRPLGGMAWQWGGPSRVGPGPAGHPYEKSRGREDLNPQHAALKAGVLPLNYAPTTKATKTRLGIPKRK